MLMLTEYHLENKKEVNILVISGILFLLIILFFKPICIFKKIFNIPCITCGMTRAFKCILKLDLINAIKYNILSIPLFIFIIIFFTLYIISIILNKNYIYKFYNYMVKNIRIFIILLIISYIINLVVYYK